MSPTTPDTAFPVDNSTSPEEPETADPVCKEIPPLLPVKPELGVLISTLPLEDTEDKPLEISILPPERRPEFPAFSVTAAPVCDAESPGDK